MEKLIRKKKKTRRKLKQSILANMIIVPFIPFVLAIGVSFYYFTTALETKTISNLERVVEDHCQMIESFLAERRADLEFITDTYDFNAIDRPDAINHILRNLKNRSNAFVDLGFFDFQGIHLRYSGAYELKGKKYNDELWFKNVMKTGYYISDIFLGYRKVPHFIIAVRKGRGKDAWVLRATIDTLFFDRMVSRVRIGRTGEAYILNRFGAAQTLKRSGSVKILDDDPDFSKFPTSENGIQTFIESDGIKNKYLYATTWLKNREWLLVVRQEKKDAYTSLYFAVYLSLMIMVVGGAVIIVMAVYITERILKNIDQLGMEKENLGNQLIRASQLAEIGEMATGFAHEINNPLQIIKSEQALVESLLDELSPDGGLQGNDNMGEIEDSLEQIKLQVNRCADITRSILKFGRKDEMSPQLLNPEKIIPEIVQLVEKKAQVSGIDIITSITKQAPGFMGDPSRFQQVLLNLFNNAIDAITEKHGSMGGILKIDADRKDNNRLEIKISDNGAGIGPENIDKVFSPFFTTKPVGKGTGLGLSVCYGIIESFGGVMSVKSRQHIGTTFFVELPAK